MFRIKKLVLILIVSAGEFLSLAQQNNTLFFLHQVPQVTFINPAVQNECKLYIGLPAISSVNINIANSGFTFNQLFIDNDSVYTIDAGQVERKIGKKNYTLAEASVNILAVGIKRNDYYYTFAIRERTDGAIFFTKDIFNLAYRGNTMYEGETVSLRKNGVNGNYFREYSLGISKNEGSLALGIRAKLLFGKMNVSVSKVNANFTTEENTFNLSYSGRVKGNASLPVEFYYTQDSLIRINEDYEPSVKEILFNGKNYGFAIDAGFIYEADENITYSGSILDLGFIRYRHEIENVNYRAEGDYYFSGFINNNQYYGSLRYYFDDFTRSVNDGMEHNSYSYFLSPRIYLGVSNRINNRLNVNALLATKIYKEKMINGLSLSANYNLIRNVDAALSWTYAHRSLSNLGVGIVAGRNPVQFYAFTDNVIGFIRPDVVKNINLHFGFNVILGCGKRGSGNKNPRDNTKYTKDKGCVYIEKAQERNIRKQKYSGNRKSK